MYSARYFFSGCTLLKLRHRVSCSRNPATRDVGLEFSPGKLGVKMFIGVELIDSIFHGAL